MIVKLDNKDIANVFTLFEIFVKDIPVSQELRKKLTIELTDTIYKILKNYKKRRI